MSSKAAAEFEWWMWEREKPPKIQPHFSIRRAHWLRRWTSEPNDTPNHMRNGWLMQCSPCIYNELMNMPLFQLFLMRFCSLCAVAFQRKPATHTHTHGLWLGLIYSHFNTLRFTFEMVIILCIIAPHNSMVLCAWNCCSPEYIESNNHQHLPFTFYCDAHKSPKSTASNPNGKVWAVAFKWASSRSTFRCSTFLRAFHVSDPSN